MTSFYSEQELQTLGLKHCGKNVLLSRKASLYGVDRISIGDNSRVDDFCILSGRITIGKNVHIAANGAFYGGNAGIVIEDYSSTSGRTSIYAVSDDYSGETLANPTFPDKYKKLEEKSVYIRRFGLVGAGSVLLPGAELEEGAVLGAMSLCKKRLRAWTINVGVPCKEIKERSREMIRLAEEYERECEK